MKKIGIITFHRANNYGVTLQAYSTAYFLKKRGYDVQIIDYTNRYEQRIKKWAFKENGKWYGYLISFVKNVLLRKMHYCKMAFGNVESYYPLTESHYDSIEQMSALSYDVMVTGSDQVWNSKITDGIDPAFLLDFGFAKRRISIASSLGSTILSDSDKKLFSDKLKLYNAISVREQFGKDQLQPLTEIPIKVLLDPTFLLNREDWIELLAKKSKYYEKKERYILTYLVASDKDRYQKQVEAYASQLGLPVWTIQYSTYNWSVSTKKIIGARIEDFIALILNADIVLTDSFHGTSFSINLNKDFVAFKHSSNPVRVMSILERLGILDRLDMKANDFYSMDYDKVNVKLEELRSDSVEWIIKAIEGV